MEHCHTQLPLPLIPCGHFLRKETPQWIPPRTKLGCDSFTFSQRVELPWSHFIGILFLVPWFIWKEGPKVFRIQIWTFKFFPQIQSIGPRQTSLLSLNAKLPFQQVPKQQKTILGKVIFQSDAHIILSFLTADQRLTGNILVCISFLSSYQTVGY